MALLNNIQCYVYYKFFYRFCYTEKCLLQLYCTAMKSPFCSYNILLFEALQHFGASPCQQIHAATRKNWFDWLHLHSSIYIYTCIYLYTHISWYYRILLNFNKNFCIFRCSHKNDLIKKRLSYPTLVVVRGSLRIICSTNWILRGHYRSRFQLFHAKLFSSFSPMHHRKDTRVWFALFTLYFSLRGYVYAWDVQQVTIFVIKQYCTTDTTLRLQVHIMCISVVLLYTNFNLAPQIESLAAGVH